MKSTHLISTATIRPTSHNIDHFTSRIELTPWDLQLLLIDQIQKGLLFQKPTSTYEHKDDDKSLVQHLKSSLSHTLDIFYPLAGRLAVTQNEDDSTTSFHLECNGAGAEFVHAVADGVTVADIVDPVLVPDDIVYSFFTMNGVLNCESVSKPLLAVQVTELVDGVFIGCTMNHCVIDGPLFWRFFNTWSEISRGHGFSKLSQSPLVFSRKGFDGIIDLPVRIPFFDSQVPKIVLVTPPLQQRVFHFTKEKIAQLKVKANAEMGTTKISSLQALLAHLWLSITRNKNLNPDEQVGYRTLVGMRQRLIPALPEEYFGNAILFATARSTAGDLIKRGLGWAAWEINREISSKTDEEARKLLKEWLVSPKLTKMSTLVDALVTGSSPRYNVFGNDFGWGRPVAVRSGIGNKFDGKLTVFPGAEEGSIDFEACLSPETMQALEEDAEFMETISKGN